MARAPAFGRTSPDSYASYDPATSSLRTHRTLHRRGSTESFVTLPHAGMMQNGTVYQRPLLERHISARGHGLLPTPVATDWRDRGARLDYSKRYRGRNGGKTLAQVGGGPSNASHREWLMGFPIGWTQTGRTELEQQAILSFLRLLNGSLDRL